MKKNGFKNFYKILLGASLASVCFFATGCADALGGKVFDEIENAINSGEISEEEGDSLKEDYSGGLQLDGIKVLRRPSEYNYDVNVIAGADYYYNFARDAFFTFYRTYGVLDAGYVESEFAPGDNIFEALYNVKANDGTSWLKDVFANGEHTDYNKLKYYYDAIRFQITDEETVDVYKIDNPDTPDVDESLEIDYSYIEVTADISKSWNWVKGNSKFVYNYEDIDNDIYLNAYFDYASFETDDSSLSEIVVNLSDYECNNIKYYYATSKDFSRDYYMNTFVNNDFIYTLAYAIYCKVLNVPVNNACYNSSGKWIVEGYEGADEDNPDTEGDERTSSYQAYLYMQNQFKKLGSYVGLTQKNKDAIKEYILNTVIGENAMTNEFLASNGVNMYYSDIVDAVVEYCGKLTTIGKTSDEGDDERTPVGDSFIASEVLDFPSTGFFVSSNDEDEFESISANEYQSIVLMPSVDEFKVSDLWLDFKYVAKDKNGNEIDDDSLFIKIYVQIRWWTGSELKTVGQEITVYNGVVDVGEDNTTMTFEFDEKKKSQNARGDYNSFGEAVTIGKFDCDALNVKDHADKTDPVSGFDVMTVKGQNDSRHYYDVVNSSYNTGFGSYGVLKTSKFEGQSYLEITFDVEKKSNDGNYEFYVGLSKLGYHPSALETYEGV